MTVTVKHPQGAVREIPKGVVDEYLALGWELADVPEDPGPSMAWKRDELLTHANSLGIDVPDGSTKREILSSIIPISEQDISSE